MIFQMQFVVQSLINNLLRTDMLFMVGCRVENPDGMTAQEQWRIVEAADARMAEDMMQELLIQF